MNDDPISTELAAQVLARKTQHLNQVDVARRWRMSERTLERWRCLGLGPAWLKIGGKVVYTLEHIQKYEAEQLRGGGDRS